MLSSSRTTEGRAVPYCKSSTSLHLSAELLLNEPCIEEQAHARISLRTGPSTISYHVRSCQGKHKHGRTQQLPLAGRESGGKDLPVHDAALDAFSVYLRERFLTGFEGRKRDGKSDTELCSFHAEDILSEPLVAFRNGSVTLTGR